MFCNLMASMKICCNMRTNRTISVVWRPLGKFDIASRPVTMFCYLLASRRNAVSYYVACILWGVVEEAAKAKPIPWSDLPGGIYPLPHPPGFLFICFEEKVNSLSSEKINGGSLCDRRPSLSPPPPPKKKPGKTIDSMSSKSRNFLLILVWKFEQPHQIPSICMCLFFLSELQDPLALQYMAEISGCLKGNGT